MTILRPAFAVLFALGITALLPQGADAAKKRFFDPNTRSFIVYDAEDAVRRPVERRAAAPAARRIAMPRVNPRLRFRSFDGAAMPRTPRRTALARLPRAVPAPAIEHPKPGPEFDRQVVAYETTEEPGTIVIDTQAKFLYYVLEHGQAIRYGVGVGKEGFGWTGTVEVGAMREWPKWFPPREMVDRRPELAKYMKVGMAGGEENPLGARALYLHDDNGQDTLFRIHGTNEPWSIGLNVSSGCIRMLNENVTELYSLAKIGAKVIVA